MPQVPPGAAAGPLYPTTPLEDRVDYAPQINVRTDPNMFGANIAAAVQHLGGQLEKSSDELWQRAVAFKQLQNETEANKATMDTALKLGQQENAFKAKEGTNMIDAYKTYPQETQQIFEDQRAALSNPAAQRLYDQQTRRMVIQSQISAGGWAATAQKQVLDADNKAKIELAGQQAERAAADPNGYDPNAFKDYLNTAEQASRNSSDSRGLPQDAADNLAGKARSSIIYRSVKGMVKIDPARAKDFLADNKDNMDPLDYENAQALVDGRFRNTLVRTTSSNLRQDYMPWLTPSSRQFLETTQAPLQALAKRAAQILDPNGSGEKSFQIISGQRSDAQQADIWQRSDHGRLFAAAPPGYSNHRWGGAIDTVPGKNTSYAEVEKAFYQASQETGVSLSGEHARLGARDRGHYSISKDQDFTNWQPPKPMSTADRQAIGQRYVMAQLPNDDLAADTYERRLATDTAMDKRVTDQFFTDQTDIAHRAMFDRGDGQAPQNRDEWVNAPGVQDALEQMYSREGGPQKVQQLERDFANWSKFTHQVSDQATLDHIQGLKASDPEAYMRLNPMDPSLDLGRNDRQRIMQDQKTFAKANIERDPKVLRAMSLLSYKLQDPNLHMRKGGDAQEQKNYYTFVGVLQRELEAAGKPMSPKEIEDLGNRLLYSSVVHKPTSFFGLIGGDQKQPPIYQSGYNLTKEQRQGILKDLMKEDPYAAPTERDIDVEAARRAYEALIPAKRIKEGFGAFSK